MLRSVELEYELPAGVIATTPVEPRDSARLCVVKHSQHDRAGVEGSCEHEHVRDLTRHLRKGDLLVVNSTRVLRAWLVGTRVGTGGKFQGLYLGPGPERLRDAGEFAAMWNVMLRGGHLKPGAELLVTSGGSNRGDSLTLVLLERDVDELGAWQVGVKLAGGANAPDAASLLERIGLTPIPPYIRKARKDAGLDVLDEEDRERYQTVFAHAEAAGIAREGFGSVAAPTAGLHFTPRLLDELTAMGVERAEVVLHVGSGTFRPIDVEIVEEHPIHSEWCLMPKATMDAIARTRAAGGRVVCVGTTSARVVETIAGLAARTDGGAGSAAGALADRWIETKILITPGYRWQWTDGLLTNFHLPRSTLMAMVASLLPGGVDELKRVYAEAIREGYRFFSYGDAMLVMRDRKEG